MEYQSWGEIPENSFFFNIRQFEKKNLPKLENHLKWPTSRAKSNS